MPQKSIAIIGSGIAGLSLGYTLSHPLNGYHVTIYECSHRLGLDSQSIKFIGQSYADGTFPADNDDHEGGYNVVRETVEQSPAQSQSRDDLQPKPSVRVDMPLRVFSEAYYPHLTSLYNSLNIPYQPENYQASFTGPDGKPLISYTNYLLGSFSLPYIPIGTIVNSSLVREVIRYLACAPRDLQNGRLTPPPGYVTPRNIGNFSPTPVPKQHTETLLEYLVNEGYSDDFIYNFQLPTVSSIATCSLTAAANIPAYIIVSYQSTRQGAGVRRVLGGANMVANTLAANCTVLCNRAVTSIELESSPSSPSDAPSRTVVVDNTGERRTFDTVVFATQANQTAKILNESIRASDDPSKIHPRWSDLASTLSAIPYETSELVLHQDERFMPKNKEEWRSVNFIINQTINDMKTSVSRSMHSHEDYSNQCDLASFISPSLSPSPSSSSSSSPSQDSPFDGASELDGKWKNSLRLSPSYDSVSSALSSAPYVGQDEPMSTIWMNKVQNGLNPDFNLFQTWNPSRYIDIDESLVYGRSFFQRPIVNQQSVESCHRLWSRLQGVGGVYCVGSFSMGGVPLLESGVASSAVVAKLLKARNVFDHGYLPPLIRPIQHRIPPWVTNFILTRIYPSSASPVHDSQMHSSPTIQSRAMTLLCLVVYWLISLVFSFPNRVEHNSRKEKILVKQKLA